ncbi:MAG: hypothetical protein IKG53_02340 [Solobacterium sp.]|nr:hypothetical protein [Solobacterium sp.]
MNSEKFDINNTLVQLTMVIKLQQLKRNGLPSLNYGNLEDYLAGSLWKKSVPLTLHDAANEILSVPADDIVRFMSSRAVIDGAHQSIEDFSDIIGG